MSTCVFSVRWTGLYGVAITSDDLQAPIRDNNGTLTIENALETYTGNYTCHADNMAGSTSSSISLIVSGIAACEISFVIAS